MKLIALFLVLGLLQVAAKSTAQVTLKEDAASLEMVLFKIKEKSGLDLFFDRSIIKVKAKPVTVTVTNVSVEEALKQVFKDQPELTYTLEGKIISVKEKTVPNSTANRQVPIPPVDLHGKVTDENGKPVVGASVHVKGTNKGTTTNNDGEFTLIGVDDKATLVISAVNIETKEVGINGRKEINLIAKVKVSKLEDVEITTVNTGYQQLPRERLTGSFAFVNNQQLNRRVSTDILSRLEGIAPGLLFNRNTVASSSSKLDLSIRGRSTFSANDQPLIVIDNFPYDGDVNNINPNDVESITILRDAAAASIWGARSANGVIVITTKKASKSDKLSIQYNSNLTLGDKANLYYSPNFILSSDFISQEKVLFQKGYYDAILNDVARPVVTPAVQILALLRNGKITQGDADAQITQLSQYDYRNDFSKYLYRNSISQQHFVNFKGGGATHDFYFSMGYDDNSLTQKGNSNNRLSINSKINLYPIKTLALSSEMYWVKSQIATNSPISDLNSSGKSIYPYTQLSDGNKNLAIVKDFNFNWADTQTTKGFLNWTMKPIDEINLRDYVNRINDIRVNFGAAYSPITNLTVQAKYQYQTTDAVNRKYNDQNGYFVRNLINQFATVSTSGVVTKLDNIPIGGVVDFASSKSISQRLRAQANYDASFGNKHSLTILAGAEINEIVATSNGYRNYGYNPTTETYSVVGFTTSYKLNPTGTTTRIPNNITSSKTTDRFISYFTNSSYTYLSKYIVSLSGRIDKSNLFGVNTNQKSVPLFSTGITWDISKEKFYKLNFLPTSKLRITYGYNGNVNNNVSAYLTAFYYTGSYYNNLPVADVNTPANPELRWEKVRNINFGYEFASKSNFITGSFDYYLKKGRDILGGSPVDPTVGFSSFTSNNSEISGHGFDLQLNINFIKTKKISWISNLQLSHTIDYTSKYFVTSSPATYLASGYGNGGQVFPLVNRPIYAIYSYKSAGLSPTTGDPRGYLNGVPSTNWGAIISATTVDSLIYNGPSRPTYFGSFRNSISMGRFTISANLIFKFGYFFRRNSISSLSSIGSSWGANNDYYNRWQKPGDELNTNVPALEQTPFNTSRETFYNFSSTLIEKGDHIRIQDISLSYDLSGLRRIPFKSLKMYCYINNIGILWRANKMNLDPDLFSSNLPLPRTYSLGIQASF